MIDLSYITEEEQEMILAVLNRDSELKKAEEQRIKKLQKTEQDKAKLKCLTGEWFYESKSHRHRDRIHGSDIIRASMKHSKPVTILEFSEIWPDKSNFLNKENKDVYIPPELFGIIDASPLQYKRSENHYQLAETQQGTCTPSPQPQIKPRQNPFNSKPLGVEAPKTKDGHLTCGTGVTHLPPAKVQQTLTNHEQLPAAGPEVTPEKTNQEPSGSTQTPAEELPASAESPVPSNNNPNPDSLKTSSFTTRSQTKKKLLLCSSREPVLESSNDPITGQDLSPTPRGILKHSSSSCSFTDSISLRHSFSSQPTTPHSPESSDSSHSPPLSPSSERSSLGCLDRKQVRFSPVIKATDTGRLQVEDSQEQVENDLLDKDCGSPSDQEGVAHTIQSTNMSDPSLYVYVHKQSLLGETDLEPLVIVQSSPISNEPESPLPQPSFSSSGKVGEFLSSGNGSDENADVTSTLQTPFDHHEDYAEPCSSQVSEPPLSLLQQGKAIHFSPEGQAPTLAEEEGSSIAKVLEWFGRVSKDSSKATESPVSPEDEIRAVPEGLDILNAENETFTQEQMKPKPSPTSRRGLLALFSRKDIKTEVPENVLTNEELMYQPEAEKKINPIISVGQAPYTPKNSEAGEFSDVQNSSKMNIVTEGHETSIHYSTTDNVDTVDVKQMESVDQSERSPSRLANLKSFWEQENKGPKILSIKNIADTNQSEMPKLSEHENISQSRTNTPFESSAGLEDTSCMHRGLPEPHMITKHGADGSDIPSDEKKSPIFNINQKLPEPQEHGFQIENKSEESQSSSVKQEEKKDEIPPPVPTIREALTQQDPELAVSDLKSFWEKEKSGSTILTSTLESIPDTSDTASPRIPSKDINESSLNVSSPSPGPMESPERGKSLNREAEMITLSLKEKIERTHGKQNSSKLHVESSVDDTNGMSYSTGPTSPIKSLKIFSDKGKKISPRSSPIRNSPESPDHYYKSADENLIKVPNKSRTHSPKHQPKVPPGDSYPVKESKKGSPLRAFTIDINPHQKMVTECQEDTSLIRDKTGQSHTDESCLISDENDLRITSQESPASLQRLPSSGEICIRNIDGKQISPVHSKSQVQTSAPLFISPEQHKNTSDEGTDEKTTMIEEHKRLEDLQPNINLARSYISLSYQHYLGLSESTHKSGCTDQTNWQEWIRIEVGESSGQVSKGRASTESSPSRCSQLGSEEITFDSSRSASPEAWSQSRTSSVCGSTEPSPVRTVQKQANIRPISISKSLENLATLPLQGERRKNEPKIDITLSVEDVSEASHATSSTISDPEQMKMLSLSVPAFIQHQRKVRETDCTSVNSFCSERQRKYSTDTNISACSGHDSMASVSGSVMSIYSTDFGNVEVRGTIQFAINYVQKLGEFHIFIVQCRDLAVADPKRNRSDPYVKCYLLPDKSKLGKKKTSVKKKTLNPCYNEILRYKIALEDLKSHTLNLSVWHNDTFGRNSFLGEVDVDLSEWDFSDSHMMDYALKGRVSVHLSPKRINHCMEMSGEIRVALRLLTQTSQSKKTPQTGEVQIWVKECKDLPARRGTMDPFVKCTVLPDTNRKGRQKTRVVKKTANPVFNHIMVYDGFRAEDLKEACAELTVWDHDRLSNHFIGGTRLGLGTEELVEVVQTSEMDVTCEVYQVWPTGPMTQGRQAGLGTSGNPPGAAGGNCGRVQRCLSFFSHPVVTTNLKWIKQKKGKSYGAEVDWMDSSSAEAELWRRMIESQDEWVEDVVPLRMLVMARTMTKQ